MFNSENGNEIKEFAKRTLADILEPIINEAKDAVTDAAHGTFESAILGRQTIDEWAAIIIKGVDNVKEELSEETGWHYVGGKLNFAMSNKSSHKVTVSFELYYQDENKKWNKVSAESDMYDSDFTLEALEDIKSKDCISYEVE